MRKGWALLFLVKFLYCNKVFPSEGKLEYLVCTLPRRCARTESLFILFQAFRIHADTALINQMHFAIYTWWGRKSSWDLEMLLNDGFWGFESTYVSKCRNITRCRRNMVDSAFKSWWSILSDPNKIFVIRTHPEELHVLKYISSLHICTDFSQQWGQQMLTKCYPTSQGCSYDFQRLKVWPLGVPKPYRTSSYDALSPLSRSTLFVIVFDPTNFPQNPINHTNCSSRQKQRDIVWGYSTRFQNTKRSYCWSLKVIGTSLWCWVSFGQQLLTSLTKIRRNMSATNTFEDV